jgi:hypothetical protein
VAGDVALLLWASQNTLNPVTPAGWAVTQVDGPAALRSVFMWRACDGTETGSVTLTNDAATINRQTAVLIVYRGLNPAAPIDGTAQSLAETVSGTTHACPPVTTGVPDAVILTLIGERINSPDTNWTAPTGYTERADSLALGSGTGGTIVAGADDGLATPRRTGVTVTPPVWTSATAFATINVRTWTVSLAPLPYAGWGVGV